MKEILKLKPRVLLSFVDHTIWIIGSHDTRKHYPTL